MNEELRDFELKGDEPSGDQEVDSGEDTPRWPWLLALLVLVALVTAFVWFRRGDQAPPTVEEAGRPVETTPATASEEPESRLELGEVPGLIDSDDWLRTVVLQISSHPQLAKWLVTPELIRGFVAVVDNVAEGVNPRPHLEAAIPSARFAVEEVDGQLYVDQRSYARFDLLIDVIESLDVAGTAELYEAILPLCEDAYRDLGYAGQDFEPTLERSIRRLLAVPVIDRPVELESKVKSYQFVDPTLEELSPAGKQLLRLGPENLRRLQVKVRALARAAGLDV